jgi:hypothetical protein
VNTLSDLLIPPKLPFEVPTQAEWAIAEAQLGTQLPDDYKNFISTYGTGTICSTGTIQEYFMIFNPVTKINAFNFFHYLQRVYDHYKAFGDEFRDDLPEDYPFSMYPEKEGLLRLGTTTYGDTIFWETKGTPNQWTVLVMESRSPIFERYDLGLEAFLLHFFKRIIKSDILSKYFFDGSIFFKQSQPKSD